jgi:hypothetical protein
VDWQDGCTCKLPYKISSAETNYKVRTVDSAADRTCCLTSAMECASLLAQWNLLPCQRDNMCCIASTIECAALLAPPGRTKHRAGPRRGKESVSSCDF